MGIEEQLKQERARLNRMFRPSKAVNKTEEIKAAGRKLRQKIVIPSTGLTPADYLAMRPRTPNLYDEHVRAWRLYQKQRKYPSADQLRNSTGRLERYVVAAIDAAGFDLESMLWGAKRRRMVDLRAKIVHDLVWEMGATHKEAAFIFRMSPDGIRWAAKNYRKKMGLTE